MQTRTYTERSNARRAARAAGLDPDTAVIDTEDGFEVRFAPDETEEGEAIIEVPAKQQAEINGSTPVAALDGIPDFCKIPSEARREAWIKNPPKAAPIQPQESLSMPKTKSKAKPKGQTGSDKNATLLKMLAGKGSTVEALTKALDWLPHTLRARISRLGKPKSKGGEGLKIERQRTDGVTSYRIAS